IRLKCVQRAQERQQPMPPGCQMQVGDVQDPQRTRARGQDGNFEASQREPVALDDRRIGGHGASGYQPRPGEGTWTHLFIVPRPSQLAVPAQTGRSPTGRIRVMAELKDRLRADLTASMKDRDEIRTRTLRMVLTEIAKEEVSGAASRELDD